jgi:hypothetical protein
MNAYKVKVIHNGGAFLRKVLAESSQKAKEIIAHKLGCPASAIQEPIQITEQQYYN